MPRNIKNIERIQAVVGIRTKFLRAIGAGSKELFAKMQREQNVMNTGFVSNYFELENPDEGLLLMGSEVVLRGLPENMSLSLNMSIVEKSEFCGVKLSFTSNDGSVGAHILCFLTEENAEKWEMAWVGQHAEMFAEIMDKHSPGNFQITEAIGLNVVKEISAGYEKHL